MKTQKKFDCVGMKRRIQKKLLAQERGSTAEARNNEARQRGLADSILGPWAAKLFAAAESKPACMRVAESTAEYDVRERRASYRAPRKPHA